MASSDKRIIRCPNCFIPYDVTNERPGREFPCIRCNAIVTVPASQSSLDKAPLREEDIHFPSPEPPPSKKRALRDTEPARYDALIGKQVGNYNLISIVSRESMATMYKARDTRDGKFVAVKLLHGVTADQIARFEREQEVFKTLEAISHPNLPRLYECRRDEQGRIFLVMEWVEGQRLSEIIHTRPGAPGVHLEPLRAVWIASQIVSALVAVHEHPKGFPHLGLSTTNVILTQRPGEPDHVYVLDFGLSRLGDRYSASEMNGGPPGAYDYAAPEQIESKHGEKPDHRSDIFSVGVILYEMLTGIKPFHGETAYQQASMVLKATPPRFSKLDPHLHVPSELENLVFRCLEKRPDRRPQSARKLGIELLRCMRRKRQIGKLRAAAALLMMIFGTSVGAGLIFQPRWMPFLMAPLEAELKKVVNIEIDWQRLRQLSNYPRWLRWVCCVADEPKALLESLDLCRRLLTHERSEEIPEFREGVQLLAKGRHGEALLFLRRARSRLAGAALSRLEAEMARTAAFEARAEAAEWKGLCDKNASLARAFEDGEAALATAEKRHRTLRAENPDYVGQCYEIRKQYLEAVGPFFSAARLGFQAGHADLPRKLDDPAICADSLPLLYAAWLRHPTNPQVRELLTKYDSTPNYELTFMNVMRMIHATSSDPEFYKSAEAAESAISRLTKGIEMCASLPENDPHLAARSRAVRALGLERRAAARIKAGVEHYLNAMLDVSTALSLGRRNDMLADISARAAAGYVAALAKEVKSGRAKQAADRLRQDALLLKSAAGRPIAVQLNLVLRQGEHLATLMSNEDVRDAWISVVGKPLPADLVFLPGGDFLIGERSDPFNKPRHNWYDGKPTHVPSIYIAAYETTNAQFREFVNAGGYRTERYWVEAKRDGISPARFEPGPKTWHNGIYPAGKQDHPVTGVSWYEAMAYCRWRSEKERGQFSLPTEHQWELAASWNPQENRKRRFPWGMEWEAGWSNLHDPGGQGMLAAVGTYPHDRSPCGCFDMAGNAREWTRDIFQPYEKKYAEADSRFDGKHRAIRGGSYKTRHYDATTTWRDALPPEAREEDLGFRVVWTPTPMSDGEGKPSSP